MSELELDALLATPIVESASKRRQLLSASQVTITVITADQIQAWSADSLPEVLRRAVGVDVIAATANSFNVGLRGMNALNNNRVLVLLNGQNMEDLGSGLTMWRPLGISLGEIERIEIIRGPGSTLYGANAMSGVINIKTRSPIDWQGVDAQFSGGVYSLKNDPNLLDGNARSENGGQGYLSWSWANTPRTLGLYASAGVNRSPEWVEGPPTLAHSGDLSYYARLGTDYRPDPTLRISGSASVTRGEDANVFAALAPLSRLKLSTESAVVAIEKSGLIDHALTLKATFDGWQRRMRENELEAGVAHDLVDSSHALLHGVTQADLVLFGGRDAFTLGLEASWHRVRDFYAIGWRKTYTAAFAQNDLQLFDEPHLVLGAGVRIEHIEVTQGDLDYAYHATNPRASLVWLIDADHGLRLAGATGYRTPTPTENLISFHGDFYPETAPPWASVVRHPDIRTEKSTSLELGYRGRVLGFVKLDSALFVQRLDDVISLGRELRLPQQSQNNISLDQIGWETSVDVFPSARWMAYLNYAVYRAVERPSRERSRLWPEHLLGAGFEARLPLDLRLNSSFSFVSERKPIVIQRNESGDLFLRSEASASQYFLNLRLGWFIEDGEIYLAARNVLAFFRDRSLLRQYPVDAVQPIGASIVGGVILRGL